MVSYHPPVLSADKVLVTIGTPCSLSAVGTTETFNARVIGSPEFIAYAAADARLVDAEPDDDSLRLRWATGERTGKQASIDEIERLHGASLRANLGIRCIPELTALGDAVVTDIAASVPHDFDKGGLRELAGLGRTGRNAAAILLAH